MPLDTVLALYDFEKNEGILVRSVDRTASLFKLPFEQPVLFSGANGDPTSRSIPLIDQVILGQKTSIDHKSAFIDERTSERCDALP